MDHPQLETDDELAQAVAASLRHEKLNNFYLADPLPYLKKLHVLRLSMRSLTVVTPSGYRYVYLRGRHEMELAAVINDPNYAALPSAREDVESRAAYLAQLLAEAGNPAEFVMRQEVPHWWQRQNIIVPYNTTETLEQVAARMGIPVEHLDKLNKGNAEDDMMYIPLPGWSIDWDLISQETPRTQYTQNVVLIGDDIPILEEWWEGLSLEEQRIEMALTATAGDWRAKYDNVQSFESALSWIADNDKLIETYAANTGVPTGLLKTVLTAEILFDYATTDAIQDFFGRMHVGLLWKGTGVGNVHYVTLMDAYHHMLNPYQRHPWHFDSDAPNLLAYPTLEEFELPEGASVEDYNAKPEHVRESIEFQQREARYPELDFYSVKHPIGIYLATNEGTINAASIVARMYLDQCLALDDSRNVESLSGEDFARIWGRYRTSYEPLKSEEFGPNAQLAMPIAEYFLGLEQDQKRDAGT